MIFGKPKSEIGIPKHEVWFDKSTRLWIAQLKDDNGNQIGFAGYGVSSADALKDLFYQNTDIISRLYN